MSWKSRRVVFLVPMLWTVCAQAATTGPAAGIKFRLLGDYQTPAADSASFADLYWGKALGNHSGECPDCSAVPSAVADPATAGFARLTYTMGPQAPTGRSYYANLGVMLPLDRLWSSANDLRSMTRVWFKARSSVEGLTVKVNFDGPAFPFGSAGYTRLKSVVTGPDWQWYSIKPSEFKYADWMIADAKAGVKEVTIVETALDGSTSSRKVVISMRAVAGVFANKDSIATPSYADDAINILKNAKLLQFGIDPKYDAASPAGTALDPDYAAVSTNATLDIDSVLFEGVEELTFEPGTQCVGLVDTIEDFRPTKTDMGRNLLGGFWYAASDTSSDPAKANDPAVGKTLIESDPATGWVVDPVGGVASLVATFDKGGAKKHPYAGFAQLGTEITKSPAGKDLKSAVAVSFKILAGGSDPFSPIFDKAKLKGVNFQVAKASVGDSATYSAMIPFAQISADVTGAAVNVCVDFALLKQPVWYTQKYGSKAFTPDDVTKMSWTMAIQDPVDSVATRSQIELFDLKVWGVHGVGVARNLRQGLRNLAARFGGDQIQLSYVVGGAKAQIDVLALDGSRILSMAGPSSANGMKIPVKLLPGTYLVRVTGGAASQIATLPVLAR